MQEIFLKLSFIKCESIFNVLLCLEKKGEKHRLFMNSVMIVLVRPAWHLIRLCAATELKWVRWPWSRVTIIIIYLELNHQQWETAVARPTGGKLRGKWQTISVKLVDLWSFVLRDIVWFKCCKLGHYCYLLLLSSK